MEQPPSSSGTTVTGVPLLPTVIPIIDLAAVRTGDAEARAAAAAALDAACTETGFFMISGHGVPESLIAEMHDVTTRFFELAAEDKRRWCSPVGSLYRGFEEVRRDGLLLRENFQAGRFQTEDEWMLAGYGVNDTGEWEPNLWPQSPGSFEATWQAYFGAIESVGNLLLELCAAAFGLPSDWFATRFDRQASGWMANWYPVHENPPPAGSLRLGGHTDNGSLTVLYQDDQAGGLQVKLRSGEWVDIPAVPGTFVVNIGDMMAVWSNGTWADTMHRVVHPEPGAVTRPRISLPFFQGPNRDVVIEPVPTRVTAENPARFEPRTVMVMKRATYENPVRRAALEDGYAAGVVELLDVAADAAPVGQPA